MRFPPGGAAAPSMPYLLADPAPMVQTVRARIAGDFT
jgi:hypothetical protein